MPTLRELTEAIQHRPGVQTVVIVGADGLVIETHDSAEAAGRGSGPGVFYDAESIAARAPAAATAASQLGESAGSGAARLLLMEYDSGYGIILQLSAEAMLFVAASRDVALADLLLDLRRHRAPMAALA